MSDISQETIEKTIDFHGHWCPGLAVGIRASELALKEMGLNKAADEEIVAVVETDMCGIDAIQFLTGCTLGKGNLIFLDHGKNAFTFYRRSDGYGIRLIARPGAYGEEQKILGRLHSKKMKEGLTDDEEQRWQEIRAAISRRVLEADLSELFEIQEPAGTPPKKARILSSLMCDGCGELVMESRTRRFCEQTLCITCFNSKENR